MRGFGQKMRFGWDDHIRVSMAAERASVTHRCPIAMVEGGGGSSVQSEGSPAGGTVATSVASNSTEIALETKVTGGFKSTRLSIVASDCVALGYTIRVPLASQRPP